MDNTPPPVEEIANQSSLRRRNLLRWLTGLFGTAASAVLGVPLLGYFFGVRKADAGWVDLGPVADFPAGETRRVVFDNPLKQPWDGITSQTIVYARNAGAAAKSSEQFLVLSANCAHLGCPVSWFPQSGLFMCPCHGGVYYEDGARASGPPPRGMYECVWRVEQGRLQVQAPHYPTLQNPLVPPSQTIA